MIYISFIIGGLGNNNNTNNMGSQNNTSFTYTFHGDPKATFAEFFGTNNPFETFFNMHNAAAAGGPAAAGGGGLFTENLDSGMDSMDDPFAFSSLGGGLGFGHSAARTPFRSHSFNVGPRKEKPQDPPIEHDLYVSLEDISRGVTKRMKISRRVVANDGTVRKEEKVLTINVKPGWKSGTKITFQREGDQAPNKIPADIVFIIRDKPHPHFKREGSDLKYSCQISLKEVGLHSLSYV
jgi:DnaJ family protein B protein 5